MIFSNEKIFMLIPAALLLVVFAVWAFRKKQKALAALGNIELIAKLIKDTSFKKQKIKLSLILISIFLLITALARPQYGAKEMRLKRKGIDVIIAIDTSTSMTAEDIKPNRLTKAKQELKGLIRRLKGNRIGVVVFAGASFVQCPLTLDYMMAERIVGLLDTNTVSIQGTAIGTAIRQATNAFNKEEKKYKVLILLTDGEDHETDPEEAAKAAAEEGIIIYSIGIGSERGEPVPMYDANGNRTGYKENKQGEKVLSKLDVETLRKIAQATGGKSYVATDTSALELEALYNDIAQLQTKDFDSKIRQIYEERFQWFLVPALLLLITELLMSDKKKTKKEWSGRFE